jgi:hypothetical protein
VLIRHIRQRFPETQLPPFEHAVRFPSATLSIPAFTYIAPTCLSILSRCALLLAQTLCKADASFPVHQDPLAALVADQEGTVVDSPASMADL